MPVLPVGPPGLSMSPPTPKPAYFDGHQKGYQLFRECRSGIPYAFFFPIFLNH